MAGKYKRDLKTGKYVESGVAEMAIRPISVRLPTDMDAKVRALPNRTKFLREAIAKALQELEELQSA
jgi:predicted DNA-binding protein